MADGSEIIVRLLERLTSMAVQKIGEQVDMVRGVEEEVADLSTKLKEVNDQLDDAEKKAIQDSNIKSWLNRLENASYEMDDVLDEWEYEALKAASPYQQKLPVCSFFPSPSSCLPFNKLSTRHHVSNKIKQLKLKLDQILKEGEKYELVISQPKKLIPRDPTTSFVEVDHIRGRDEEKEIILKKIIGGEGSSEAQSSIQTVSIVGSGGIGKTTLAQLVYNDSQVANHYPHKIWICVSDPFDKLAIAKGIIEKISGSRSTIDNNLDALLGHLKSLITGEKFLLVLDDVWTEESKEWEPFKVCLKSGGEGSKILVTTRKKRVAEIMGTTESNMHHMELLTDEECWMIMRRMAFSQSRESECIKFEEIGRSIACKCNGLPLAATILGSMLHDKHTMEEWKDVLDNEIWGIEKVGDKLNPHLLLSYNDLSSRALKQCFSFLSVFPQDTMLQATNIINYWLALGYLGADDSGGELELRGRDYFHDLAMRSLLQDFEKDYVDEQLLVACKMHDIVHDFARSLRKDTSDNEACCLTCSLPVDLIANIKKYRSLVFNDGSPAFICDCMKNMRVFVLMGSYQKGILNGVEKLIHLRHLQLNECKNITTEDLKMIFKLYNLKVLVISKSNLEEIPREIGNLVRLRQLDLNMNFWLKELPDTICDLKELHSLDVGSCFRLCGLPPRIHKLTNFKYLNCHECGTFSSVSFSWEGVGQLTGLRWLDGDFTGRLKHLKKLNQLGRSPILIVDVSIDDVVDDARAAELHEKACLQQLLVTFSAGNELIVDSVWVDLLSALRPHQNLASLYIEKYGGIRSPNWIVSPLNQLRKLTLAQFHHPMWQFPALGKLPCLEELNFEGMKEVKFMGREFLGITTSDDVGSPSNVTGFPKLKKLVFWSCLAWEEWEDITAEEEVSTTLSLFPQLSYLKFFGCDKLKAIPHRLWRKMTALNKNLKVEFHSSPDVEKDYKMMMMMGVSK